MTNPTHIANTLTEAQRRALLWLSSEPKVWPKGAETSLYCMAKVVRGDPRKGVAMTYSLCEVVSQIRPMFRTSQWVLTPLGAEVKAILEQQKESGE